MHYKSWVEELIDFENDFEEYIANQADRREDFELLKHSVPVGKMSNDDVAKELYRVTLKCPNLGGDTKKVQEIVSPNN